MGPLPCFPSLQSTIMQSRSTGIADHILPLGDLLDQILDQTSHTLNKASPAPNCALHSKSDQLYPKSGLLATQTSFQAQIIPLLPQMLPLRPLVRYLKPHASSLGNHRSLAPLTFWAASPKGRCPVGHRGEFPYVLRGYIWGNFP